jgi:hypothetical protein
MYIQISLYIRGHWIIVIALIDSGTEVNMIYLRLVEYRKLVRLDDHVTILSLFNRKTETLGSCDLLTWVKDNFSVVESH